ncbi:MAG: fatty acid desaturase [Pseudomonadota bacterium]
MDLNVALQNKSLQELRALEREIAREHLGKFPWFSLFWGTTNLLCWLALWPLVLLDWLPLWLGCLIASANIALCYLPSHEAQHSIFAMPGTRWRWLNELVGHLFIFPLLLPFRAARATHLQHHKYTNDPERDPDYDTHAETLPGAVWASLKWRQLNPRSGKYRYLKTLHELGRQDLVREVVLFEVGFIVFLCVMAWHGFALEAGLLWWVPRHIGMTYLHVMLSWAPHNPGLGVGRYQDTHSFRSVLGNVGTQGMQYHIVHHLYPRIPLARTPRAYWQMRAIIKAQGGHVDRL